MKELTEMVHHHRLAPSPTLGARLLRAIGDGCIQQQVIDLITPNLLQRLLRKGLDCPHI